MSYFLDQMASMFSFYFLWSIESSSYFCFSVSYRSLNFYSFSIYLSFYFSSYNKFVIKEFFSVDLSDSIGEYNRW